MRPTSDGQVTATTTGALAELETVREGIHAFAQPFGSAEASTLSYLVEDDRGGVHLIDPGADSDDAWARLERALATLGRGLDDLASVTVTHLHEDHLGMAERVRAGSGAPVALHRAEQSALDADAPPLWVSAEVLASWGVPGERMPELTILAARRLHADVVRADVLLEHGDRLPIAGRELRVIHTPGHTIGSICVVGDGVVFTGDTVLPNQFAGIGLGGVTESNPIADLRRSLETLAALDDHEALPGHAWRFEGLAERCAEIIAHHARRTAEVAAVLQREPDATVWRIAQQLTWSAGWAGLQSYRLGSALGQTQLHADLVRSR